MDSGRSSRMGREMIPARWCRHRTLPAQIPLGDGAKQHDLHGFAWAWWDSWCLQPLQLQPLEGISTCVYWSARVWLHLEECPILLCSYGLFTARLRLKSAINWSPWGSVFCWDNADSLKLSFLMSVWLFRLIQTTIFCLHVKYCPEQFIPINNRQNCIYLFLTLQWGLF